MRFRPLTYAKRAGFRWRFYSDDCQAGKPCVPGCNAARDGCIPAEGDPQPRGPETSEELHAEYQVAKGTLAASEKFLDEAQREYFKATRNALRAEDRISEGDETAEAFEALEDARHKELEAFDEAQSWVAERESNEGYLEQLLARISKLPPPPLPSALEIVGDAKKVQELSRSLFGAEMTEGKLIEVLGLPPGVHLLEAKVRESWSGDGLSIHTTADFTYSDGEEYDITLMRLYTDDERGKVADNSLAKVEGKPGSGIGTRIVAAQAKALHDAGIRLYGM